MCKKETSVSHSSTESEIITLDAGLRLDGIPALDLWDLVIEVFHSSPNQTNKTKDVRESLGNLSATPHPSLLLMFLDSHFETFPDLDDLTDVSVHAILPNFTDLKAKVKRTPHEDEEFGYLADSTHSTGYEPKKFDKITSVDNDTMLIDDPDLDEISDFSKNTHENTGQFGVLTMFESSFSHVSHDDFALQIEDKV